MHLKCNETFQAYPDQSFIFLFYFFLQSFHWNRCFNVFTVQWLSNALIDFCGHKLRSLNDNDDLAVHSLLENRVHVFVPSVILFSVVCLSFHENPESFNSGYSLALRRIRRENWKLEKALNKAGFTVWEQTSVIVPQNKH